MEGSLFHCIVRLYGASLSKIIYNSKSSAGYPSPFAVYVQIGYLSCRTFLSRVLDLREVCIISLPFKLWALPRPGIWLLQPCHSCPVLKSLISFTVACSLHWSYTAMDISFPGISTNIIILRRLRSMVGPLAAIECSGTEMPQYPPPLPSKGVMGYAAPWKRQDGEGSRGVAKSTAVGVAGTVEHSESQCMATARLNPKIPRTNAAPVEMGSLRAPTIKWNETVVSRIRD